MFIKHVRDQNKVAAQFQVPIRPVGAVVYADCPFVSSEAAFCQVYVLNNPGLINELFEKFPDAQEVPVNNFADIRCFDIGAQYPVFVVESLIDPEFLSAEDS